MILTVRQLIKTQVKLNKKKKYEKIHLEKIFPFNHHSQIIIHLISTPVGVKIQEIN
jgi:hypothetical protein